jgi:4-hydroxybenzoyl-CoA thioesterase/acyl-CoA thioester hydrolase
MPIAFRVTRRVEFSDTDMAGIMHFSRFFAFLEQAEHEFLRSLGLSVIMVHDGRHIGWPRVAANFEFYKPVKFEELIDIHLMLHRIGTKSLSYTGEFYRDGQLLARGQLTTCCCLVHGPEGMTPLELPADLRRKLEQATSTGD